MKTEIWKDVVEYEDLYQVSNLGRVKSIKLRKEKILKPLPCYNGYYGINLCKNGNKKRFRIHRLVAQAFIGKISEGYCVNHINEVKTDNRLENLEIITFKENVNYGTANARRSASHKGRKFSEEHKRKLSEAKKGKKRGA